MDLFDEIMNRGPGFYPISGKALMKIHGRIVKSQNREKKILSRFFFEQMFL